MRSIVYDDVPPAFERWTTEGKIIAIYSSGSVLAQKLLFGYTDHGDLTPFISANFDTNIGHKREAESYRTIAQELNCNAENILFLSDIPEELAAAEEAGYQTRLVVRPGNAEHHAAERFTSITSFEGLD